MSDELYTFIDITGKYRITISRDWFKARFVSEAMLKEFDLYTLNTTYSLNKFLHNPSGPAIEILSTGATSFYINGEWINDPNRHPALYKEKFNEKFDDFLKDDT